MKFNLKKKSDSGPANGWIMTFADLMSLLMCFFVLLLSFSEMDLQKYKQISGSMKEAFGVQRDIKSMEMPKGTSIIAQEFSPGRPSPSVLKVLRQDTIDETKQTLLFTDALTRKENAEDTDDGEIGDRSNRPSNMDQTGTEAGSTATKSDTSEVEQDAVAVDTNDGQKLTDEEVQKQAQLEAQTMADVKIILEELKEEIKRGMVQVESEGTRILIRIQEKGSFPSGSATFQDGFLPVLEKLRTTLANVSGKVLIAGHTDNIPINTSRFRSNWELSASRAVSVVHELLREDNLDPGRFLIEGHGEAHPIAPNDTAANRALNRRVELTIVQGDTMDEESTRGFEEMVNNALAESLEISEISPEPGATEQTAMLEQAAIPEVSIELLKPVVVTALPVEIQEQTTGTTPVEQTITGSVPEPEQADLNKIEERIRRFTEKMEKHKTQN